MSTPPDSLARALDDAIGAGPPLPPVADHLAPGRRAVRRRRTAVAAGALAVAVAVGGTTALTAGGADTAGGVDPAAPGRTTTVTPTQDPVESPDPAADAADAAGMSTAVSCGADGAVAVTPGATVLDSVANPLDRRAPATSHGLEVRSEGETTYWLLDCSPRRATTSSDPTGKNAGSLREWLTLQPGTSTGNPTDGLVRLGRDGVLAAGEDVTILDQRAPVDVGERFAPADAATAAALVERDGVRWWVLARRIDDGRAEYFPVDFGVGGDDMEAFLDHAASQYAGGEGLK